MGRYLSPMSDETSRQVRPGELRPSPASRFWPDQSPSLNTPGNFMGLRDGGTDASQRSPGWERLSVFGGIGSTAGVGVGFHPWDELHHRSSAPVNFQFVLDISSRSYGRQVAASHIRQRRGGIWLAVFSTMLNCFPPVYLVRMAHEMFELRKGELPPEISQSV